MKKFVVCSLLVLAACGAPSNDGKLDKAYFQLDNCSVTNLSPCESAATGALEVLASNPNSVQAALLASSGIATMAGVDMLSLVSEMTKTTDSTEKFKAMHDAVISTIQDITDLRDSIDSLLPPIYTGTLTTTDDYYRDYYFQVGILQSFEIFVLPTIMAQPTSTSLVTPTLITAANYANVMDDFIDADDNLVASGITDSSVKGWDIVKAVRQNYCVLDNIVSPFTLPVLQDLTLCQLCIGVTNTSICPKESSALVTADFQSGGLVTKCSDFDFTACANAGPTS